MFDLQAEFLTDSITRYRILSRGQLLQFDQVIALWRSDADFRGFFTAGLAASPFGAYRFETPAVGHQTSTRIFEFVLVDSPWLDVNQDPVPFAGHFAKSADSVIEFDNLGADATLIVPCPLDDENHYAHIAAFLRQAPPFQKHRLWEMVGDCIWKKISEKTIWLNTAGGGVDWLHVRLDSRPKYYAYTPYKST